MKVIVWAPEVELAKRMGEMHYYGLVCSRRAMCLISGFLASVRVAGLSAESESDCPPLILLGHPQQGPNPHRPVRQLVFCSPVSLLEKSLVFFLVSSFLNIVMRYSIGDINHNHIMDSIMDSTYL